MKPTRVTVQSLRAMKSRAEKISMVTAYDATFAKLCEAAGAEILLVGDSMGMVIQGHDTTLPVTMDHMVYHCAAVARGAKRAHIVGDLPFMSYQASTEQALQNAGRLMKEGNCHAVKLEGGAQHADLVTRLTSAGIPVMGHLGLTPQSVHQFGGFKVQGRGHGAREQLMTDALALESAGAYCIVLEGIPAEIAAEITAALTVPTIGIGAGVGCDGQVLVIYDLLGMDDEFRPRFVRRFDELGARIREAVGSYVAEVRAGTFPSDAESFPLQPEPKRP